MLHEILNGNENPRWLSGGHIGFLIGSKIEHDLSDMHQYISKISNRLLKCYFRYWAESEQSNSVFLLKFNFPPGGAAWPDFKNGKLCVNYHLYTIIVPVNVSYFKPIAQTFLETLSRIQNPRLLAGGHIEFPIGSKIKLDLLLICTNKCAKLQINCSNASWDIEQKQKFKMAAWQPYSISNELQNRTLTSSHICQ